MKKPADVVDSWTPEGVSVIVHNDSFSDDEDLLHCSKTVSHISDDDPNAKFNRSWIR